MDTANFREAVTDAIRYWEPRRIAYNALLAAIVIFYFIRAYPSSMSVLTLDSVLGLFLLAVLANVAYCAAYLADIFAQWSSYRDAWRRYRWGLFVLGLLFAGVITRFMSLSMFYPSGS